MSAGHVDSATAVSADCKVFAFAKDLADHLRCLLSSVPGPKASKDVLHKPAALPNTNDHFLKWEFFNVVDMPCMRNWALRVIPGALQPITGRHGI